MKDLYLALLAALMVVVLAATVNLTGEWEVESNFDDGALGGGGFDCALTQDGERLTGTCSGGSAELTGELKGQSVSWKTGVSTYTGTVNDAGTAIKGRFAAPAGGGSFSAVRSK